MSDDNKKPDDDKFNDTLKKMLRTPPKPHNKGDTKIDRGSGNRSHRPPASDQGRQDSGDAKEA